MPTRTTSDPATRAVVFSSATDNWATPKALFDQWHREFNLTVDACASQNNKKAATWWGLDHPDPNRRDGLTGDWAHAAQATGGAVWVNPPYGRGINQWMAKAASTAEAGVTVVCLVPARTDTAWFHDHVLAVGAEIRHLRGRIKFGTAKNSAPFPNLLIVYRGNPSNGMLERYEPQSLTADQWQAARQAVVAAVEAANPTRRPHAVVLAGTLCQFLAWHPHWDGTSAPNLGQLLTRRHQEAYLATVRGAGRRTSGRRQDLRRLAKAVRASRPVAIGAHPGSMTRINVAAQYWPNVRHLGPFTALAAAYQEAGNTIHPVTFHGLTIADDELDFAILRDPSANATPETALTVAAAREAAKQLSALAGVTATEVTR